MHCHTSSCWWMVNKDDGRFGKATEGDISGHISSILAHLVTIKTGQGSEETKL